MRRAALAIHFSGQRIAREPRGYRYDAIDNAVSISIALGRIWEKRDPFFLSCMPISTPGFEGVQKATGFKYPSQHPLYQCTNVHAQGHKSIFIFHSHISGTTWKKIVAS